MLLDQGDDSSPVAYAIVNDVPLDTQQHFRKHEGIEILSYDTQGGKDFSGFDDYLGAIYEATNPLVRFGRLLEKRRILWVDPHPENNGEAFDHLKAAAEAAERKTEPLVTVASAQDGVAALASASSQGEPFDLAITHWGDGAAPTPDGASCPGAVGLLTAMRSRDLRCPVIVFAGPGNADERKRTALGLGALAYCFSFGGLYRTVEDALSPASLQQTRLADLARFSGLPPAETALNRFKPL